MTKQTTKKVILLSLVMLILFNHIDGTTGKQQDRINQTYRLESTYWQEMKRVFRSIRYNPANIYDSVFSNSGWSLQ